MKKKMFYVYGIFNYVLFLGVFLYFVGFMENLVVPKSIDSSAAGQFLPALITNLLLITLFAVPHSIMARPTFKKWWTNLIPKSIERTTYVLVSSILIFLLIWQWQPMPQLIWEINSLPIQIILWIVGGLGWLLVAISPRLINDKHFFGIQQVRQQLNDQPLTSPEFQTPGVYRFLRHPIMVGFFLAFWSTPHMSVGHLVFSIATTIYILIALRYEERDLIHYFGDRYRNYKRRVRMFIPIRKGKTPESSAASQS